MIKSKYTEVSISIYRNLIYRQIFNTRISYRQRILISSNHWQKNTHPTRSRFPWNWTPLRALVHRKLESLTNFEAWTSKALDNDSFPEIGIKSNCITIIQIRNCSHKSRFYIKTSTCCSINIGWADHSHKTTLEFKNSKQDTIGDSWSIL